MSDIIRKLFILTGRRIRCIIDFFYPPFSRWLSPQLFRYAACGAANMGFSILLFFIAHNFLFAQQLVEIFGIVTLTPHVASLLVTFPISLMTGFLLQKYVTFTASNLRGRVQLVRYISVVTFNLLLNYAGLKFLVEVIGLWATPAKMVIDIVTAVVSYLCQRYFTFKS